MDFAARMERIPVYVFTWVTREISEREARGIHITNLGLGNPDLTPPDFVLEAMRRALYDPQSHRYPSYTGLPELHDAIAHYYARRFAVELDPKREVLPLIGSKEGIANIATALVDPGDLVLVPDPGYPTYAMGSVLNDGEVYYMPLRAENDFLPDLDAIPEEIYERAVAMWLNYPNNPTGAIAPLEYYAQVVALANKYDFAVLSDNPYADVTFDGYRAPSFLETPGAMDVAIEFNSLSKTYNMAGERIGMAVGNAALVDALLRVKSNVDTGIFPVIQHGAIAALTGPQEWIADRNKIYEQRRDVAVEGLRAAGFEVETPKAALYAWPKAPAGWNPMELAMFLLDRAQVWITPGSAFGPSGDGYLRVAFCTDADEMAAAFERVERALREYGGTGA